MRANAKITFCLTEEEREILERASDILYEIADTLITADVKFE